MRGVEIVLIILIIVLTVVEAIIGESLQYNSGFFSILKTVLFLALTWQYVVYLETWKNRIIPILYMLMFGYYVVIESLGLGGPYDLISIVGYLLIFIWFGFISISTKTLPKLVKVLTTIITLCLLWVHFSIINDWPTGPNVYIHLMALLSLIYILKDADFRQQFNGESKVMILITVDILRNVIVALL